MKSSGSSCTSFKSSSADTWVLKPHRAVPAAEDEITTLGYMVIFKHEPQKEEFISDFFFLNKSHQVLSLVIH